MQQLDFIHMRRCFELAKQGQYTVTPNPMVGCVVVRGGEVLAEGYHLQKGEAHAERDALLKIENAKVGSSNLFTFVPSLFTDENLSSQTSPFR